MTERRRSQRLNSNPRAERYETRTLRSNCGRAARSRLPQQKYVVLRDSFALMTNNKMFPGAQFTETTIKKEYRWALGRVCSEPERDAASVEIEWKDNEKGACFHCRGPGTDRYIFFRTPSSSAFFCQWCPSCGDWIGKQGRTLQIGELLQTVTLTRLHRPQIK